MSPRRDPDYEPMCDHERRGIVTAGGPGTAHAACNVCDRFECISDAIEWAEAVTLLPARHIPDSHDRE